MPPKRPNHAAPLTLAALALLPLAAACQGFTQAFSRPFTRDDTSLTMVDELLERIERVHVDAEVAKGEVHELLDAFYALNDDEAAADPLAAHGRCRFTSERSKSKAEALRESVTEMQRAAGPFFERWRDQLAEFVSAELRERSRERMDETRARYDAIVDAVLPALDGYEELNQRALDLTVYLAQDFNPDALSSIDGDVRGMTDRGALLVTRFDDTLVACERYLRSAALPGRLPEELDAGEGADEPVKE
jgi:hypothetical protein